MEMHNTSTGYTVVYATKDYSNMSEPTTGEEVLAVSLVVGFVLFLILI